MPDISDDEMKEFQGLRSRAVGLELDVAKSTFRAENPHVPAGLVAAYQGDPAGMGDFGKVLLEQFPKPQAPPPVPASQATTPPAAPTTPPAPVPDQGIPAQASSPIMAAQFPVPLTPEAQRQAYLQQQANGGVSPIAAAAPVPAPGSSDILPLGDTIVQRSAQIREKMRIGRATIEEAQWLSQYGERGFLQAAQNHARKVAATVGRNS